MDKFVISHVNKKEKAPCPACFSSAFDSSLLRYACAVSAR